MTRRFSPALHPVHRIKHIIDSSATLAKNTQLTVPLIVSVDAPVIANTTECETGSKVHGIYLKVETASNIDAVVGGIPNVYLAIAKQPAGTFGFPNANALGPDPKKRFVIHQEMVMIENTGKGGNSRILFNGVIKIPKGMIRNGPADELQLLLFSPVMDIVVCVQCHYKEFR